jgi:hypothetical protein
MTIRHLEKRLRKAESTLRCEPNVEQDVICALLWFAVAYYLGDSSGDEKPFVAYARALGYAGESELNRALENNDRDLDRKVMAAEIKLLAKFDWTPGRDDLTKFGEALPRMNAGLPKSYVDQMLNVMTEAKISLGWLRNESKNITAYIHFFA